MKGLLYAGMNVMRLNCSHGERCAKVAEKRISTYHPHAGSISEREQQIEQLRDIIANMKNRGDDVDYEDGNDESVCAIALDTKVVLAHKSVCTYV